ncbi:MAG: Lrp/AsnC ligand binding domain-containing protein [Fimbriimonadaceae bacterium]|nr:Lrp/AsnC ligand binding domain-containing protein [Chitinophagales bacterium]
MIDNSQLDKLDIKILDFLMHDAMMPYTDIAKKLFVSSGTIHVRMKKLMQLGIIKSANLHINPGKLGYDIVAFLGIYLEKSSLFDNVVSDLKDIPEITECYYLTGNYSMFVKLVCKDTLHLRNVLHDKIQPISGIDRTETFISLEESFNRPVKIELKKEEKKKEKA